MPSGERYLDIHKVAERVDLSPKTVRRWVRLRRFPAPFRWGKGHAWLESDIDRWMVRNAAANEIDPEDMPTGDTIGEDRGQTRTSQPEDPPGPSKPKKSG